MIKTFVWYLSHDILLIFIKFLLNFLLEPHSTSIPQQFTRSRKKVLFHLRQREEKFFSKKMQRSAFLEFVCGVWRVWEKGLFSSDIFWHKVVESFPFDLSNLHISGVFSFSVRVENSSSLTFDCCFVWRCGWKILRFKYFFWHYFSFAKWRISINYSWKVFFMEL